MATPTVTGFVGTGAITDAMVRGLLASPPLAPEIVVSPRNAGIAERLKRDFSVVRIASDNQAVVDACDTVFLAVRPQIAEEVITTLRFRPEATVISVIATLDRPMLLRWIGAEVVLVQAIPYPSSRNAEA